MSEQPTSTPFYYNDLLIVLSLFCCFPVGVILMWTGNKWTKGVRIGVTLGVLGLMLLGLLAPRPPAPSAPTTQEVGAPPERVSQAASLSYVTESCQELAAQFGAGSDLSELQKEELWKGYKGKGFRWSLRVTEVRSMMGSYHVQFKCAPTSSSFISDIQVRYKSAEKPFVLGLKKDEVYEIVGVLRTSGSIMGMAGDGIVE